MDSMFLPYDPVHGAMQQQHHNNNNNNNPPPPPPPPPQPMDLASSPIQEKAKPGRPRRSRTNNVNVNNINNGPPPPASAESSTTPTTTGFSTADGRIVEIKTKFPVARIKRIMQADEDVGKVAQVTPVVVSKALELFMIALCEKASAQARQRNSKRITAGHLKQAVLHEEQFDFLAEIIAKVPDIPLPSVDSGSNNNNNGGNCSSGGGGPESEDAQAPPSVKKPRKPRTRKVKNEDC